MFDLNKEIKSWRRELERHPGLEPGYIEELESHLRDKIDWLMDDGMSEKEAFHTATEAISDTEELAIEFHKSRSVVDNRPNWREKTSFIHLLPNFLKITLRNFNKHKGYSVINITGLAIGLACCILIFFYVSAELSYDKFHTQGEQIYRLSTTVQSPQSDTPQKIPTVGWPVGRYLADNFPEVEELTYIRSYPDYSIKHDGQYFFEDMMHADASFFDLFSFSLIEGNPETALSDPYSIVITQELKNKFFGNQSAIGQQLILSDSISFTVTGVAQNIPDNSHIQFDVLISFSTLKAQNSQFSTNEGWMNVNMINYVRLNEKVDPSSFQQKTASIYNEEMGKQIKQMGYDVALRMEPLQDIYLRTEFGNQLGPVSNINYVYLLSIIGFFILGIACINFMNLATARSTERAREVGIRKVVGSDKKTLISQFMTESVLISFFALVVALLLISQFLPQFNSLTGKEFHLSAFLSPWMIAGYLLFTIFVGILAGLYPAFVLSGYQPLEVLNSYQINARGGTRFRKVLVVFQFAISCVLIACTLIVKNQLDFMQNQNLGFQKEQVVTLDARRAPGDVMDTRYSTIKQELLRNPAVESASAAFATPGRTGWSGQIAYPGTGSSEDAINTEYLAVDFDYIKTLNLEVVAGRNFSKDFQTDAGDALIINETAVEAFGWKNPENAVGKEIKSPSGFPAGSVIGVVKDYHHHGLEQQIPPLVMDIQPNFYRFFVLRFEPGATQSVIDHMESTWNQFFPGYSFDYFFLDQDFARQYRDEQRLGRIFTIFSVLAIFIACLGLVGLAAFAARKRSREIGIRKVLGATAQNVVMLLAKDFLLLVGMAFLVAAPVSYYAMQQWLQQFPYRTDLGIGVFALTAIILLSIAVVSVLWQSLRAALQNPVNSIRS